MTISQHLDKLRTRFPECDIAAYADLSTGMVLAATSATKVSQESLDTLCEAATDTLKGPLLQAVSSTATNRQNDNICHAVRISRSAMEVFVKSNARAEEAMCLVCKHDVDVHEVTQHAQTLLDQIEAEH